MTGTVAIFYDIENLLKGYGSSQNYINSISLKYIFNKIKSLDNVKFIAVQRAYANWSDPRLSVMKGEINELGIDPIQIFGFSRNTHKNAADIQLAVDAIDLAYLRSYIEIFVIVSGDGGFSALAKKLHEYGKYVIGCAYFTATNKIFESVCDIFIGIEEPEDHERERGDLEKVLKITNPKVIRLSEQITRISTKDQQQIINQSQTIINWFLKDSEAQRELGTTGIHLSVIKEAFKYGIEDFNPSVIGLPKFVNFLQFICSSTEIRVFRSERNETIIARRNYQIKGFEALPDIESDYLHSLENYQSILAHGSPCIKMTNYQNLKQILMALSQLDNPAASLDRLLDYINHLYADVESEIINASLITLINTDLFERQPADKPLSEQTLQLKSDYLDYELSLNKVKEAISSKLSSFWGEHLNSDTLNALLSDLDN
ncbi:MAG: NYN domain-containing protein [Lyngbya sp.]|nr:NYN domain-containing protein [Lyngbya sp.]